MHPAAAHLASVAPAAELDVVGMGADRQRRRRRGVEVERRSPSAVASAGRLSRIVRSHAGSTSRIDGWARSAGVSTSSDRSGSRAHLDAIPVGRQRHRLARWRRTNRRRSAAEIGARAGNAITLVPSRRRSGTRVTIRLGRPARGCAAAEGRRARRRGDRRPAWRSVRAVVDRAVQAEPLAPDHVGAVPTPPIRPPRRRRRPRTSGCDRRPRAHRSPSSARTGALTAVERADEPALRRAEPLHGDEHGHLHWRRL